MLPTGEYFHIYNRGVDKRSIFEDPADLWRFLKSMEEFNTTDPIGGLYAASLKKNKSRHSMSTKVSIVAYCLNKNHFHFILKSETENGISSFMQRLSNGYTKYYNEKHNRSGSLFQGKYKRQLIETNEYLLHVSAYVNLNDRVHPNLNPGWFEMIPYSSFVQYIHPYLNNPDIKVILEQFPSPEVYKSFAESSVVDILERKEREKELRQMLIE